MASQLAPQLRHVSSDPNLARPVSSGREPAKNQGLAAKRAVGMSPLKVVDLDGDSSEELEICDSPGWDGYKNRKKTKQAAKDKKALEKAEKKKVKPVKLKKESLLGGPRMGEAEESASDSDEPPKPSPQKTLAKAKSIGDLKRAPSQAGSIHRIPRVPVPSLQSINLPPLSLTRPPVHARQSSDNSQASETFEQDMARQIYHMNMDSRPTSSHSKMQTFQPQYPSEPLPERPEQFKKHLANSSGESNEISGRSLHSRDSSGSKKSTHSRDDSDYVSLSDSSYEEEEIDLISTNYHQAVSGYSEKPRYAPEDAKKASLFGLKWPKRNESDLSSGSASNSPVIGSGKFPRRRNTSQERTGEMTPDSTDGGRPKSSKAERILGERLPPRVDTSPVIDPPTPAASPAPKVDDYEDISPKSVHSSHSLHRPDLLSVKSDEKAELLAKRKSPQLDAEEQSRVLAQLREASESKMSRAEAIRAAHLARVAALPPIGPVRSPSTNSIARKPIARMPTKVESEPDVLSIRSDKSGSDKSIKSEQASEPSSISEQASEKPSSIKSDLSEKPSSIRSDKPISIIKESDPMRSKSPSIKRVTIKSEPDSPPEGSPKKSPQKKFSGYPTPPGSARESSDSLNTIAIPDEARSMRHISSRLHSRHRPRPSPKLGPQAPLIKPMAKVFVVCCNCRYWHDMPSRVFELIARPPVIEEEEEGNSEQQVHCPWCEHPMNTRCCAGWAGVVQLTERLH